MAKYITITPEARYWVRSPEGKWTSIRTDEAAFLYGTPGSSGYATLPKRRGEIVELVVLPFSYKHRSDVGMGVAIWDWARGPLTCADVERRIDKILSPEMGRPSSGSIAFILLRSYLCRGGELTAAEVKELEEIRESLRRNNPGVTESELTKRLKF